jgi:integrase
MPRKRSAPCITPSLIRSTTRLRRLDRAAVVRALDALTRRRARQSAGGADKRKGTAMTGQTAAYGRAAFAWAMKRGMVQANPFGALPVDKSIGKRERVLSDGEIGEIWHAAGEAASPYGTMIRLLILTGQRRGEVAGMAWREISDDLTTWTMPSGRTKNGVAHRGDQGDWALAKIRLGSGGTASPRTLSRAPR